MEINSDDGYTGTITLEDGTVISISGGFISYVEKDGSILIDSVMAYNDELHKSGITKKIRLDGSTALILVNGMIISVETADCP